MVQKSLKTPLRNIKMAPKGPFNSYVDKKRGRGVSKKSMLVHSGGGRSLECPRGPKFGKKTAISKSISYHCALEIKFHYIELNFRSYCH